MKYGLGIDTGGTYTDAAIFNFENHEIVSTAKSVTVKEDLTKGINNVLYQLPSEKLKNVKLVSVSTTLATNACVENKGGRAKLILIGCDKEIVSQKGPVYGLPDAEEILFLEGGHNQQGEITAQPDWNLLKQQISACNDKVDGFAVVELWGIRNAQFEKKAKNLLIEWTSKPVVCGHELTDEINSLKRAASTLLNAQLIPLINDFINAVKSSLAHLEIKAPLVIVRGDGSLMSENFARQKPVETLLSGPASSVAGGTNLTGEKNCVIVDMGGTTTDLAIVKNGIPLLAKEGVNVGDWKTGTRSIYINTFGLGGDSVIRHTKENEIFLGPVRVAPISWLAHKWPDVMRSISKLHKNKKKHTVSLCEFFYLLKDISEDSYYNNEEKSIVNALKSGPKNILELSQTVGTSIYGNRFNRLEQHGIIMRSGLTPTDIMHLSGDFCNWNKEAALMATEIMAFQLNMHLNDFINKVTDMVKQKLYFNITKMLLENEKKDIFKKYSSDNLYELIMLGYHNRKQRGYLTCSFSTDLTLIGIGAPIHIYLPDVAKNFNAKYIIPDKASVANAVGAITGNITVESTVTIKPKYETAGLEGFTCYSSDNRKEFLNYNEALNWAKTEASRLAKKNAEARGAVNVKIITDTYRNEAILSGYYSDEHDENHLPSEETTGSTANTQAQETNNTFLVEVTVTARAVGSLKWL